MPRKTPVRELQKEESTVSSPLRRSSRISNISPAPTKVLSRRNSATETSTSTPKATRSRRASFSQDQESAPETDIDKKITKVASTTRSHKGSFSSNNDNSNVTEEETAAKIKTRGSSVPKEATAETRKPSTRRRRSVSEDAEVGEEETVKKTTRSRSSLSNKKSDNVEDMKDKKASTDPESVHVSTPMKKSPSDSANRTLESIEEATKETDSPVTVEPKINSAKKKKMEAVKIDLELSIINETSLTEDDGTPQEETKNEKIAEKTEDQENEAKVETDAVDRTSTEDKIEKMTESESSSAKEIAEVTAASDLNVSESSFHLQLSSSMLDSSNKNESDVNLSPSSDKENVCPREKSIVQETECEPMDVDESFSTVPSPVKSNKRKSLNVSTVSKCDDVEKKLEIAEKVTDEIAQFLTEEIKLKSDDCRSKIENSLSGISGVEPEKCEMDESRESTVKTVAVVTVTEKDQNDVAEDCDISEQNSKNKSASSPVKADVILTQVVAESCKEDEKSEIDRTELEKSEEEESKSVEVELNVSNEETEVERSDNLDLTTESHEVSSQQLEREESLQVNENIVNSESDTLPQTEKSEDVANIEENPSEEPENFVEKSKEESQKLSNIESDDHVPEAKECDKKIENTMEVVENETENVESERNISENNESPSDEKEFENLIDVVENEIEKTEEKEDNDSDSRAEEIENPENMSSPEKETAETIHPKKDEDISTNETEKVSGVENDLNIETGEEKSEDLAPQEVDDAKKSSTEGEGIIVEDATTEIAEKISEGQAEEQSNLNSVMDTDEENHYPETSNKSPSKTEQSKNDDAVKDESDESDTSEEIVIVSDNENERDTTAEDTVSCDVNIEAETLPKIIVDEVTTVSDSESDVKVHEKNVAVKDNVTDSLNRRSLDKTSIVMQENIKAGDGKEKCLSDRIHRVVDLFCAGIKDKGDVSINVSLECTGQFSDDSDNENSIPNNSVDETSSPAEKQPFQKGSKRRKIHHFDDAVLSPLIKVQDRLEDKQKNKCDEISEIPEESVTSGEIQTKQQSKKKNKKKKKEKPTPSDECNDQLGVEEIGIGPKKKSKKQKSTVNDGIEGEEQQKDEVIAKNRKKQKLEPKSSEDNEVCVDSEEEVEDEDEQEKYEVIDKSIRKQKLESEDNEDCVDSEEIEVEGEEQQKDEVAVKKKGKQNLESESSDDNEESVDSEAEVDSSLFVECFSSAFNTVGSEEDENDCSWAPSQEIISSDLDTDESSSEFLSYSMIEMMREEQEDEGKKKVKNSKKSRLTDSSDDADQSFVSSVVVSDEVFEDGNTKKKQNKKRKLFHLSDFDVSEALRSDVSEQENEKKNKKKKKHSESDENQMEKKTVKNKKQKSSKENKANGRKRRCSTYILSNEEETTINGESPVKKKAAKINTDKVRTHKNAKKRPTKPSSPSAQEKIAKPLVKLQERNVKVSLKPSTTMSSGWDVEFI